MVHVCDLAHTHCPPAGRWIADWSQECPDYGDANAIMRTHRPVLQLSLRDFHRSRLQEANYRQIVAKIDPNFLLQGRRADSPPTGLPQSVYGWRGLRGVRFNGFDNDTAIFYVTSSEIHVNGTEYMNLIKFMSWEDFCSNPDMTPQEKALRLLNESDIQVYCNDPSFLYWGFQYILTQLNPTASIYPEPRPPHIRNPGQRGIVCKHLNRIMRVLPFYNGDIAKAITAQWGGKIDKRAIDAIRRRNDLQRQANALPPEQVQEVAPAAPVTQADIDELNNEQTAPAETPPAPGLPPETPPAGPAGTMNPNQER